MEGVEIVLYQNTVLVRSTSLRVCRAKQVKQLFYFFAEVAARHKLSQVIISLDHISLLRCDGIRQAFIQELSAYNTEQSGQLIWAGGSAGDATFIRSVSAMAKTSLRHHETEHQALMALHPLKAPEAI
jgi:hypothetical protein